MLFFFLFSSVHSFFVPSIQLKSFFHFIVSDRLFTVRHEHLFTVETSLCALLITHPYPKNPTNRKKVYQCLMLTLRLVKNNLTFLIVFCRYRDRIHNGGQWTWSVSSITKQKFGQTIWCNRFKINKSPPPTITTERVPSAICQRPQRWWGWRKHFAISNS